MVTLATSSKFAEKYLLARETGVPAGAAKPVHATNSKPSRPTSLVVGTSGSDLRRTAPVTASARSRPDLMCGSSTLGFSIMKVICPPNKPATALAPPLYGMCTTSKPAARLKSSPAR